MNVTTRQLAWTHAVRNNMDCPDDGDMSSGTECRHVVDLDAIRKRAQDYITSFGAGNWGRDDDVWIDTLRPSFAGSPQDAVLMGRFIFAVSPDAILAIIDALQKLDLGETTDVRHQPEIITTVEQLDALPCAADDDADLTADIDGAAIKDSHGYLYEKNANGTWATMGDPEVPSTKINLPALVLWSPSWDDEAVAPILGESA